MSIFDVFALGRFYLVPTIILTVGCGGEFRIAPVSGSITLDGEPLSNASVYFQPQRSSDNPIVGPPSFGVTDSDGHYTVQTTTRRAGAVVGEHVVSVSTFESRMVDPQNSDRTEVISKERVPKRYRAPSRLTITIPSGGVSTADFELTTE